ncbi:porin [Polynucleobacter sp. AP-Capit-er-40B-B4]|uniref:porin n=1 Tax=Polynucleobacter sp. AP-Capit-er-40B-B4 TaxID=2576927 RepID=UPI001C0C1B8B|nr:porin [Polynucleobacter sp. AP-Capit-er-40B-B4]MBU3581200.1 porin [Polynucleobacter sp. AP-Capit-er-40B-B4]
MKKSLLAVAAIGAFASAAQAQSSVTVYGIIDAGYIGSNAREGSVNAASGQALKIQKSAFGQSAEQTSRLGFKGTEDLGGGASAFFTVELGLTPQNSELSGGTAEDRPQRTTNASGSAIDNRQSFVGVKKNGVGQFAFGRQYTPMFNTGAATSPGQYNNVVGDLVYTSGSAFATGTATGNGTNNGIGFTNRASNALTLQSDTFAGFQVGGLYAANNQNQTELSAPGANGNQANYSGNGGNTNWGGWGLNGSFTWQKLYVGVAYQSFKTQYSTGVYTGYSVANVGSPAATSGQVVGNGQLFPAAQISDKQTLVGATYDFGILKAYAQWVGRKVQNDYNTPGAATPTYAGQPTVAAQGAGEQLNRTAQQIGVRSYITPTIESWASVGTGKVKATYLNQSANFFGYQLGSNYYLSKRTNLYAIYGQTQTSSSSITGNVGAGANQYAVGVRHTF